MTRIHVYVADKSDATRRATVRTVRESVDMRLVGETGDGWEAVDSAYRLDTDVILMDIELNGLSGIEAARKITEAGLDTSVLIYTSHDSESYLTRTVEAGARGYLLKKNGADLLATAIRTVHAGDVFFCPPMMTMLVNNYLKLLQNADGTDQYRQLSAREREVLTLIGEGQTAQEIAKGLVISPHTVETYRKRVMRKLELHSKTELVKYALRRGIVRLAP